MTTIARVAQVAEVGVGTVSRVLNGSPAVSDHTRRRVLAVIDDLGYAPNATARALSTGRTHAVGVIAPFFTQPSVTERLRGVTRALAPSPYRLVLFDVERPEQRDAALRSLVGRVDGVLSISLCPTRGELAALDAAGVPLVLVDHAHDQLPAVSIDDVEGGRLATNHLIGLGHEWIAFLGETEDVALGFTSSARRRAGYERALTAAGLAQRPSLVRLGPHGREAAAAMACGLLAAPRPPTAVFAASDVQALGLLEAAEALGLDVPGDLSVVGFDDIEVARYAGLTTVAQPLQESGVRGAEMLLDALAGVRSRGRRLPLELIVRATTGERSSERAHPLDSDAMMHLS